MRSERELKEEAGAAQSKLGARSVQTESALSFTNVSFTYSATVKLLGPEALRHGGGSLLAQILGNSMQPVDVVQEEIGVMASPP